VSKFTASKILSVVAIAGALSLSLAACSSSSSDSAASCTPTKAGASSEKVKVTGKFGAEPKVTFAKGLTSTSTQRTVETDGKGIVASDGTIATVNYTAYNGTTGKELDTTGFTKDKAVPFTVDTKKEIPGLYKTLHCATAGSRIVSVIPPKDAFGSAGQSDLGVGAKDSLVFVMDIRTVKEAPKVLKKANGKAEAAPKGYPTVKLAANGEPTITIPKTAAPTTLEIADLKKGTGATVKSGANVTVHYTGVVWETGKVFDSSWTRGEPASFSTTGVIPGFSKALVGQKVGSQVIAVIPPADGYGTNVPQGQTDITPTSTLVFVVDILGTN